MRDTPDQTIYTTNQWHPQGPFKMGASATCQDREMLLEWVNQMMAEYSPEGYGTEAVVICTETGYLARVERYKHCN